MGRKSAYKEEYNQLAENYALLGATDKEMADLFSVTERTLNQWKKDYPEFLQSLKKGKNIAGTMRLCYDFYNFASWKL